MAGRNIKGITVEIGGDTTGLNKALESVNKQISNTQSQLKDVEKLLKLDPGNTELLTQKHRLLGDAVSETKEKLTTLKTAAEQANAALADGKISQEQYDALQREIAETEQALKRLETQAENSVTALQKIGATGEKLQKVGDSISGVGEKFLPATAAVTGLGTAAVKTAADFDTSMSKVAAVSGAEGDEFDALRDKAREMGAKTKFSASEAADAMNYMAMAGWKTEEMLSGIEGIMNLAAASGESLATTSDIVTDALSAFGLTAADSGHFADILAAASSNANTNVAMLGESFKYAAPVAGALGVTAEDTSVALGLMANAGIKASQGGTNLRTGLSNLAKPTKQMADYMAAYNIALVENADGSINLRDTMVDLRGKMGGLSESEQAAAASAIFGKESMSGWLAIINASDADFEKLTSAIDNCGGETSRMAATMQDNLGGQLTILKSQLEELAISFGDLLMPIIRDVVGHIQSFVDKLNSMDEGTRKVILTIAAVVAAVGPVLIVIGKVVSSVGTILTVISKLGPAITAVKGAFSALGAVLAANPIGIVIAAIAALVAAFVALWNNCEGFRQFWIGLWENIKSAAITAWEAVSVFLPQTWENIKSTAESVWNGIGDFFRDLWAGISEFFSNTWTEISETAVNVWNGISTTATNVWTAILDFFIGILGGIQKVFTDAWSQISSTVSTVVSGISSFLSTTWNSIRTTITTTMSNIGTTISTTWQNVRSGISSHVSAIEATIRNGFNNAIEFIKSLPSEAYNWGADIINNIVSGIKGAVDGVKKAVSNVASTIREYLHFSVPDVGPLADFEEWMPDFMAGLANGIEKSRSLVQKAVSSVAADMVINPKIGNFAYADAPAKQNSSGRDSTENLVTALTEALHGANSGGDIVIPVYLGTTMLDEIVVSAQQRMNLRSGGR